jgi:hypothetical protein
MRDNDTKILEEKYVKMLHEGLTEISADELDLIHQFDAELEENFTNSYKLQIIDTDVFISIKEDHDMGPRLISVNIYKIDNNEFEVTVDGRDNQVVDTMEQAIDIARDVIYD